MSISVCAPSACQPTTKFIVVASAARKGSCAPNVGVSFIGNSGPSGVSIVLSMTSNNLPRLSTIDRFAAAVM